MSISEKKTTSRPKGYSPDRCIRVAARIFLFFLKYFDATTSLTFPGIRDFLGGALLSGQKLLNTLRLAGHFWEWRTATVNSVTVTNRSYDFGASVLCPALNDGAPYLVLAHVVLLHFPYHRKI